MKNFFRHVFHVLSRIFVNSLGFIEGILLFKILWEFSKKSGKNATYIILIIPVYILFINFKYLIKVINTNANLHFFLMNQRTIAVGGEQRAGKTSICGKVLSKCSGPVFSLTPMKLNGVFVNILKPEHLFLENKLPENSVLFIDEATLLFNNQDQGVDPDRLKAFEILLQLIGHFFNGSILYASVDTGRLVKVIREKFFHNWLVLGQSTKRFSFILAPLLTMVTNWKWYGTYRIWRLQTFEKIPQENYIFDLSNENATTNNNKYANLFDIVSFNNKDFEYNDRYLKKLYDLLDLPEDTRKFESLEMDPKTVYQQYKPIIDFLVEKKGLHAFDEVVHAFKSGAIQSVLKFRDEKGDEKK